MTVEEARLGRRLDALRRDRMASGRADRPNPSAASAPTDYAAEADAEIRRRIAAIVAAGFCSVASILHTRRILFSEHGISSQRARSSKEVTEADAFLCDLDPSLCALCVSTPLLWLRLRRARLSGSNCVF